MILNFKIQIVKSPHPYTIQNDTVLNIITETQINISLTEQNLDHTQNSMNFTK